MRKWELGSLSRCLCTHSRLNHSHVKTARWLHVLCFRPGGVDEVTVEQNLLNHKQIIRFRFSFVRGPFSFSVTVDPMCKCNHYFSHLSDEKTYSRDGMAAWDRNNAEQWNAQTWWVSGRHLHLIVSVYSIHPQAERSSNSCFHRDAHPGAPFWIQKA